MTTCRFGDACRIHLLGSFRRRLSSPRSGEKDLTWSLRRPRWRFGLLCAALADASGHQGTALTDLPSHPLTLPCARAVNGYPSECPENANLSHDRGRGGEHRIAVLNCWTLPLASRKSANRGLLSDRLWRPAFTPPLPSPTIDRQVNIRSEYRIPHHESKPVPTRQRAPPPADP